MPASNRQQRRGLGFEPLETKASPTSLVGALAWPERLTTSVTVGAESPGEAADTRFTAYVALTPEVSLSRELPSQLDAQSADMLLIARTPPLAE